jgi:CRP-like cAMP-binding protein
MSTTEIEDILGELEFFSGLNRESMAFLAECAQPLRAPAGTVVFQCDGQAGRFFVIRHGLVTLEIPAIEGPRIQVQTLGAREILEGSWLSPCYKCTFQARAEEDTELIAFDGQCVRDRCEEDPAFGYEMLKRFSALTTERLKVARRKMMDEWSPPGFA